MVDLLLLLNSVFYNGKRIVLILYMYCIKMYCYVESESQEVLNRRQDPVFYVVQQQLQMPFQNSILIGDDFVSIPVSLPYNLFSLLFAGMHIEVLPCQ